MNKNESTVNHQTFYTTIIKSAFMVLWIQIQRQKIKQILLIENTALHWNWKKNFKWTNSSTLNASVYLTEPLFFIALCYLYSPMQNMYMSLCIVFSHYQTNPFKRSGQLPQKNILSNSKVFETSDHHKNMYCDTNIVHIHQSCSPYRYTVLWQFKFHANTFLQIWRNILRPTMKLPLVKWSVSLRTPHE